MFVGEIGEVGNPSDSHTIDKDKSVVEGNQIEVDALHCRP